MTLTKTAGALLAAISLVSATSAQAKTCITRAEISGMMAYAMPGLLTGIRNKCVSNVAKDGYLATSIDGVIQTYATQQDANWPLAKAAFVKFAQKESAKESRAVQSLPDSVLKPLVEAMMPAMIGEEIKPTDCADIEEMLRLLAPLPPENTAGLFGTIMALAGGSGPDDIAVCRGPQ
jgi:hypothetical protein